MTFQKWSAMKVLMNFKKLSNMPNIWGKNEDKPCLTCLNPFFGEIPDTRKLDFGYSFHAINFNGLHRALKFTKKCNFGKSLGHWYIKG